MEWKRTTKTATTGPVDYLVRTLIIFSILLGNFNCVSSGRSSSVIRFRSDSDMGASRLKTTSLKVSYSPPDDSPSTRPALPRSIFSNVNTYKQSQTYKISSKPCIVNGTARNSNENEILRGTCMFVWECIKSEGKHLGMCIDGFMFGSCCSHNDTHNIIPENESSVPSSTSSDNLPFVTGSHNSSGSSAPTTTTTTAIPTSGWSTATTTEFFFNPEPDTEEITEDIFSITTDRFTTRRPISTSRKPIDEPPPMTTSSPPNFVTFTEYIPEITTPSTTTTTTTTTTTEIPTKVTETIVDPSSSSTKKPSFEVHNDECGVAPLFPQKRIVGGREANFGSWPWIVSVRRTSFFGFSSTHRCGGTLINENWVITAGHCVDDLLISQIRIRIGEWDFSVKGGDGTGDSGNGADEKYQHIERGVLRKVVHGSYNFFTYENDLALLYLDGGSVNYSQHIRPLCLQGNKDLLVGHNATVAGWGRLSEGGVLPNRLQQVTVPIMSNEECRKLFLKSGRAEHIPDIFLCAGYPNGGRDSCQGDSGGPLQVKGSNGRWFLAGIISWGIGCAEPNMPGVCTRISKFTEWILKHVT